MEFFEAVQFIRNRLPKQVHLEIPTYSEAGSITIRAYWYIDGNPHHFTHNFTLEGLHIINDKDFLIQGFIRRVKTEFKRSQIGL